MPFLIVTFILGGRKKCRSKNINEKVVVVFIGKEADQDATRHFA